MHYANRMTHTEWLIPTFKKDDGSSDCSATSKVLNQTGPPKYRFQKEDRGRDPRTVESADRVLDPSNLDPVIPRFSYFFGLVRPNLSNSVLVLIRNGFLFFGGWSGPGPIGYGPWIPGWGRTWSWFCLKSNLLPLYSHLINTLYRRSTNMRKTKLVVPNHARPRIRDL